MYIPFKDYTELVKAFEKAWMEILRDPATELKYSGQLIQATLPAIALEVVEKVLTPGQK